MKKDLGRGNKKMRRIRVLGFSLLYFLLFAGYFLFLAIQTLAAVQPLELSWYLQHPLDALAAVIIKWGRNPLVVLSFLQMMVGALVLGFITDWIHGIIRGSRENTQKMVESSKLNPLRIIGALIATAGGALMDLLFGMTYMSDKTMNGLGLSEGGTSSRLEMETLRYVADLMLDILPTAKFYSLGITSLAIISIGILSIWSTRTSKEDS